MPPSRKPVTAERAVSCGMSPRNTVWSHQRSFCWRVQVWICSSVRCGMAIGRSEAVENEPGVYRKMARPPRRLLRLELRHHRRPEHQRVQRLAEPAGLGEPGGQFGAAREPG